MVIPGSAPGSMISQGKLRMAEGGPDGFLDDGDVLLLHRWQELRNGFRRIVGALEAEVEQQLAVHITQSSALVLWHLLLAPDRSATMADVSGVLGFTTAGTTKMIDRLVTAGLIERRPSDRDRRVVYAALTEAGADTARDAVRALVWCIRGYIEEPMGADRFAALCADVAAIDPGRAGS